MSKIKNISFTSDNLLTPLILKYLPIAGYTVLILLSGQHNQDSANYCFCQSPVMQLLPQIDPEP